jgi:small subunit ribosomal protein S13
MEQKTTQEKQERPRASREKEQGYEGRVVRILSKDIEGKNEIYHGLTKVRGISWGMANAICKALKIDKRKKIGELTNQEIQKIADFMKNPEMPSYLMNRRKDFETGENRHLLGTNLELQHEFDIKRLRKIRSYRGYRHAMGLPSRGQRTRSHFRKNRGKSTGIKKKPREAPKSAEK